MSSAFVMLFAFLAVNLCRADSYQPTPGNFKVGVLRYDWHDDSRNRDVPVKIYYPKHGIGPFPVIIFSHGLGGSREGYSYLGKYWAAHGYVSVHPEHNGSDDGIFKNGGLRHLQETLSAAISNPQNSYDRAQDASFAIDQMQRLNSENSPLQDRLDLTRIGMAGHSFGAATALMISGERVPVVGEKFADPRVKAAIAMSPPIFAGISFNDIHIPVFVLTGTLDAGFTSTADRRTAYDKIQSPETCLVIFNGADHMTFSGHLRWSEKSKDKEFHPLILAATTAYWDAHLRNDTEAKAWLEQQGGFATLMRNEGKFRLK